MHLQSLIIARTGWEHLLSQPLSFESLQWKALPLDRADCNGRANVDVIRVPLPDAIHSVVDLEKREDTFIFQDSGSEKNPVPFRLSLDQCLHHRCSEVFRPQGGCCGDQQQWADQHIAVGEEHGYKHCLHLVQALRRVQVEMKNETYTTLAPMWFKPKMIRFLSSIRLPATGPKRISRQCNYHAVSSRWWGMALWALFRSVGLVSSIMPKVILSGDAIDQRSAENGEGGWATVTEPSEIPTTCRT